MAAFAAAATDFNQCRQDVEQQLATDNGTTTIPSWALWTGPLQNFRGTDAQRPLTLTTAGCRHYCGTEPQYNDVIGSFQILTTWILPAIALMSQFPYESLSREKQRNAEAFANWIGAPAAAIATTFWNIVTIHQCATRPAQFEKWDDRGHIENALYILSCVNQYEYPRRPETQAAQDRRRDTALLRGVLYPYVVVVPGDKKGTLNEEQRAKLENLNEHLSFQLRLQRRKGVSTLR